VGVRRGAVKGDESEVSVWSWGSDRVVGVFRWGRGGARGGRAG